MLHRKNIELKDCSRFPNTDWAAPEIKPALVLRHAAKLGVEYIKDKYPATARGLIMELQQ